ncbi:MAG: hypothetical protein AAF696_34575, partial [Bacteroidota bacterium]
MKTLLIIFCLEVLLVLHSSSLFGQTRIEFRGTNSWSGNTNEFWLIESINPGNIPQRVYVKALLTSSDGRKVFQARSQVLLLPPGRNNFAAGDIITEESSPLDTAEIPEATYLLCINLYREQDDQPIANTCSNIFVKLTHAQDTSDKLVGFSGRIRLYGQLSNRISLFDDYDPSSLNAEIEPQISIKGIPFGGRIFLSTQKNSLRYDLNTASLQFDSQRFKQLLQQKFLEKLGKYKHALDKGLPVDKNFAQSLEQVKAAQLAKFSQKFKGKIPDQIFKDLEKAKKSLQELDRIEEIMSLKTFKDLDQDWETWAKKAGFDPDTELKDLQQDFCKRETESCKKHMKLLAKKEEWEKLKARREKLLVWKARYKKLKKYEAKLKQMKSLRGGFEEWANNPDILKQLPLMDKAQGLLSSLEKVGIGTVFPHYSPLTVDGISLQGWDLALQTKHIFLASSGGKLGRSALGSFSDSLIEREGRVLATKVGYG